jgi:hypothetical protein
LSYDAETACRPSGVTAHAFTKSVWPSSVAVGPAVAAAAEVGKGGPGAAAKIQLGRPLRAIDVQRAPRA